MRNGGLLPTKGHFWVTCAASEKKIELATSRSAFLNPFGLRTPFYSQCVKTPKTFVYVGNMCSNKLFQKLKLTHLKSTSLWIWDNKIKPITSWHLFWDSNCKFPKTNKKSRQKSWRRFTFFASPFNVWLEERDSPISMCTCSAAVLHVVKSWENSPGPPRENESGKSKLKLNSLSTIKETAWPCRPLKGSRGSTRFPKHPWESLF